MNVVLVKDFPPLGFQGEVIKVKEGYAYNDLIRKRIAVFDFPGVRERLFPNISNEMIELKKMKYKEEVYFKNKIEKIQIEFIKNPSFSNINVIKDNISKEDIVGEVIQKYQLKKLKPDQIKMEQDIQKFGSYIVEVENYENENHTFNFTIKINVTKPQATQAKIE